MMIGLHVDNPENRQHRTMAVWHLLGRVLIRAKYRLLGDTVVEYFYIRNSVIYDNVLTMISSKEVHFEDNLVILHGPQCQVLSF